MRVTGSKAIDRTIQQTNIWLDDVLRELNWSDRHRAYHALRAVLHTLRDRLPVNESVDLAAQLPLMIRGVYYEGWKPNHVPIKERRWEQFVAHVSDSFILDVSAHPEQIALSVLRVPSKHVSAGEIADVKQYLPDELRVRWPAA